MQLPPWPSFPINAPIQWIIAVVNLIILVAGLGAFDDDGNSDNGPVRDSDITSEDGPVDHVNELKDGSRVGETQTSESRASYDHGMHGKNNVNVGHNFVVVEVMDSIKTETKAGHDIATGINNIMTKTVGEGEGEGEGELHALPSLEQAAWVTTRKKPSKKKKRRGYQWEQGRWSLTTDRQQPHFPMPQSQESTWSEQMSHQETTTSLGDLFACNSISRSMLGLVFSFLDADNLIESALLVCPAWADITAEAIGNSIMAESSVMSKDSVTLRSKYGSAQFLSSGGWKRVFKVLDHFHNDFYALSVMDIEALKELGCFESLINEIVISIKLSSLVQFGICPNFVITRDVFTSQYQPHAFTRGGEGAMMSHYDDNLMQEQPGKLPNAHLPSLSPIYTFVFSRCNNIRCISRELCEGGDMEEHMKKLPGKMFSPDVCRMLLFQMAFALYVAHDRFGLKHYDVKLLNFLLWRATDASLACKDHLCLRYGLGPKIFCLRMPPSAAFITKLADYGTSVMASDTDGQPVSQYHYTTLENTPPDFLILGNEAKQGCCHDFFGLGLCMFHLLAGHAPYEEILSEVVCPGSLRDMLRNIWKQKSHDVINSVILGNNESGTKVEGHTLCDTLYRFLVLFGIPKKQFSAEKHGKKVWGAINSTLLPPRSGRSKSRPDAVAFEEHQKKFSLASGTDERIAEARHRLENMDGAMDLLLELVSFDPKQRPSPLDIMNSKFMKALVEDQGGMHFEEDNVMSFMAYFEKK